MRELIEIVWFIQHLKRVLRSEKLFKCILINSKKLKSSQNWRCFQFHYFRPFLNRFWHSNQTHHTWRRTKKSFRTKRMHFLWNYAIVCLKSQSWRGNRVEFHNRKLKNKLLPPAENTIPIYRKTIEHFILGKKAFMTFLLSFPWYRSIPIKYDDASAVSTSKPFLYNHGHSCIHALPLEHLNSPFWTFPSHKLFYSGTSWIP